MPLDLCPVIVLPRNSAMWSPARAGRESATPLWPRTPCGMTERRVAGADYGNAWQARCVAPFVAVVFFMTIPGLAVALVLLAALDRFGMWVHNRSGLPWYRDGHRAAAAPGFDELQAALQSSARHVIERRRLESALRDEEHDGAPPHIRTGPGEGRAVIIRAARRAPASA